MHSERHVLLYGTNPLSRLKLDNGKLAGRGPQTPTPRLRLTQPKHPPAVWSSFCQARPFGVQAPPCCPWFLCCPPPPLPASPSPPSSQGFLAPGRAGG